MSKRQLITEMDVRTAAQSGKSTLRIAPDAIITPLALDTATGVGVRFEVVQPDRPGGQEQRVVLGVARAGFSLKRAVLDILNAKNLPYKEIRDTGSDAVTLSVEVVKSVVGGGAAFGIIIDAEGILPCMIANRFEKVRAVNALEARHAQTARRLYNANIITLGSEYISAKRASDIVGAFLTTHGPAE